MNCPYGKCGWEHPNFANLLKSLLVIANEAKRNEAIATFVHCDCFASLRYVPCGNAKGERNDKLYFYTFGMLPLNSVLLINFSESLGCYQKYFRFYNYYGDFW